jgi:hypothetical protein
MAYAVGCVDGVTPDCSDASTGCGPNLDGTADTTMEVQTIPEAATPDGADADVVETAAPEASDPDADAGDEI